MLNTELETGLEIY